jgi:hypothetical protein
MRRIAPAWSLLSIFPLDWMVLGYVGTRTSQELEQELDQEDR